MTPVACMPGQINARIVVPGYLWDGYVPAGLSAHTMGGNLKAPGAASMFLRYRNLCHRQATRRALLQFKNNTG